MSLRIDELFEYSELLANLSIFDKDKEHIASTWPEYLESIPCVHSLTAIKARCC